MDELDKVIDTFIEYKFPSGHLDGMDADTLQMAKESVRDKLRNNIENEIKEKHISEIVMNADKEIERNNSLRKYKELKEIMWQGFIVAFVVGLSVNQITDIISFFKGTSSITSIGSTLILSIILVLICIGLYFWSFARNFIEIINNFRDNQKEKQEKL